jgi:hypothetical protein
MAEPKTRQNKSSVSGFLKSIENPRKRADCRAVAKMMRAATGSRARMWGSSIVGFGHYDYSYASGQSGTSMLCGFSPRKRDLTIYIMPGFSKFQPLLKKLGKHKTGKSCLYIKELAEVDQKTLATVISRSVKLMKKKYNVG